MKEQISKKLRINLDIHSEDIYFLNDIKIMKFFPGIEIYASNITLRKNRFGNMEKRRYYSIVDNQKIMTMVSIESIFENYSIPIRSRKTLEELIETYCKLSQSTIVKSKKELTSKYTRRGENEKENKVSPPKVSIKNHNKMSLKFYVVSDERKTLSSVEISSIDNGKISLSTEELSYKSPKK